MAAVVAKHTHAVPPPAERLQSRQSVCGVPHHVAFVVCALSRSLLARSILPSLAWYSPLSLLLIPLCSLCSALLRALSLFRSPHPPLPFHAALGHCASVPVPKRPHAAGRRSGLATQRCRQSIALDPVHRLRSPSPARSQSRLPARALARGPLRSRPRHQRCARPRGGHRHQHSRGTRKISTPNPHRPDHVTQRNDWHVTCTCKSAPKLEKKSARKKRAKKLLDADKSNANEAEQKKSSARADVKRSHGTGKR